MSTPFQPVLTEPQPELPKKKFNLFCTNYHMATCIVEPLDYDSLRHIFWYRFRKPHIGKKQSAGYFVRVYKMKHYLKYWQKNGKMLELGYFRCKDSCENSDCFIVLDIDSAFKLNDSDEIVTGAIPPPEVISEIIKEMGYNHFGHSSHNFDENNQKSHFIIESRISYDLLHVTTQWFVIEINKRLLLRGFDYIKLSVESMEASRAFYFPTIEKENDTYKAVECWDAKSLTENMMMSYQRMRLNGDLKLLGLSLSPEIRNPVNGKKQPQSVLTFKGTSISDCYKHLKAGKDGAHPYYWNMAKYFKRIGEPKSHYLHEVTRVLIEGNNPAYVDNGRVLPDRQDDIENVWRTA